MDRCEVESEVATHIEDATILCVLIECGVVGNIQNAAVHLKIATGQPINIDGASNT